MPDGTLWISGPLAVAVALTVVLALGMTCGPLVARAQVSPGQLAGAHQELDQPSLCFKCHARGGGMTQRCLDCHTGIAAQRSRGRGLHGREARQKDCASCHPDHAGRHFDLVRWDEGAAEKFDHRRVGYLLTGKHATLACLTCHQSKHQRPAVTAPGAAPEPAHRWLGLGTSCISCHADPHRARFGNDCQKCHTTRDWKSIQASRFDHDLTRYPLRGKHAGVACEGCHDPASPAGKMPFASCGSCHKDAHAGQAAIAGRPADCSACHTVQGFTPSTFTVAMHRGSRYPLEGRHAEVTCASCHPRRTSRAASVGLGSAGVVLRPPHERCVSCHADAHRGQLVSRADREACETCHTMSGWRPSRLTLAEHAAFGVPLVGAHARTACTSCHTLERRDLPPPAAAATLGPARFAFQLREKECSQCHHDPHGGRFGAGGRRPKSDGCRACHDQESWRPALVTVDMHRGFGFALEGAHRAVPCTGCHGELKARPKRSSLMLAVHPQPLPFDQSRRACADCHADIHQGQFAERRDRGACDACHELEVWRPATRFVHDRDSRFKLAGAHATVGCGACHTVVKGAGNRPATRYRGVPVECASCHAPAGRSTGGKG